MAGTGPIRKDDSQRVRRNKPAGSVTTIYTEPEPQPSLPTIYYVAESGKRVRFNWPLITQRWWRTWAESPLSSSFTSVDWAELMVTARLHAKFWGGDTSVSSELRLRVGKFGATPEDRARLRITFADANAAEGAGRRKSTADGGSRERYAAPTAVDNAAGG